MTYSFSSIKSSASKIHLSSLQPSIFLALFSVLRPGDEIIVSDPTYRPTRRLTEDYLREFDIKTVFTVLCLFSAIPDK